jgi:hypothetical protein
MLEKASSTTTEHVCERYYAALLWTASGLLPDTSAEKLATWLQLKKEDSVLVQDTCAALMHLREPWLRGGAGANGEWEKQVFEMLQFETLVPTPRVNSPGIRKFFMFVLCVIDGSNTLLN